MEEASLPPVAPSFVLNLGKDSDNLCLHFNPRFNMHGDANTIVCNSKDGGAWGTEQRESAFPFQPGSVMEVGWGLGARGRVLGGLGWSWVWWLETYVPACPPSPACSSSPHLPSGLSRHLLCERR